MPDFREFLVALQREFGPVWAQCQHVRAARQRAFEAGAWPTLSPELQTIRESAWRVALPPHDLHDRRAELIVAASSTDDLEAAWSAGANVLVVDFDDLFSSTWENVQQGHRNLQALVERRAASAGQGPVLMLRPRGWHLSQPHVPVDRAPAIAALYDVATYLFHCAAALREQRSGPYLYLPKVEDHLEARLWSRALHRAEALLRLPYGAVRVTVQIETVMAALEMDEILYELQERATGLNAGRWDYLFNMIKRLGHRPDFLLPDRRLVTMAAPFMQAYAAMLVQTAHRRGAHAIGGTAGLVPDARDPAAALDRVRADKEREAAMGFDGAWAAHPALVAPVQEVFRRALQGRPHQEERAPEGAIERDSLLHSVVPGGAITIDGLRESVAACLSYLCAWGAGVGSIVRNGVVEDMATAELARAQLWQWVHHRVEIDHGAQLTPAHYVEVLHEEANALGLLGTEIGEWAMAVLNRLVLADRCIEFFAEAAGIWLTDLNHLERAPFVRALGAIFEDSPWVADRVWPARPFDSRTALHTAMVQVVQAATSAEQRALICAHPDLAERARPMSGVSQQEQTGAGLDRLTNAEFAQFMALNQQYRLRFGHPFLMAVRGKSKEEILSALATRIHESPEAEFAQALREIYQIAWFRLLDAVLPEMVEQRSEQNV